MKWSARMTIGLACLFLPSVNLPGGEAPEVGGDRALILVGLPGDPDHASLFQATAKVWRDWLVGPLGFPAGGVRILSVDSGNGPSTRDSIATEAALFCKGVGVEGRAWVFVLGHANLDDGHARLHLPGPDLSDDEFAGLFRGLVAKEQVFWVTTAGSGSFLGSLAGPGRVVIAATERAGESNETEFPHALAEVVRRSPPLLDSNKDGRVSVLEVFLATVEAVDARFRAHRRIPTEHAQLDDDGDGRGSEPSPDRKSLAPDGTLASKILLPTPPKPPTRSAHAIDRVVPPAR